MNKEALTAANAHNPRSPGKFEAEQKATVYFWYCLILDGDGETNEDSVTWFDPTPEEQTEFTISAKPFWIEESDNGFVYGGTI